MPALTYYVLSPKEYTIIRFDSGELISIYFLEGPSAGSIYFPKGEESI
jgi:hypothetical protein